MKKRCIKCNIAIEEKYCFCPFCGKKLEPYNGKVMHDTSISNEKIYNELQYFDRKSTFSTYLMMVFALQTIGIAFLFGVNVYNKTLFSIIGIILLFTAIAILIYGACMTSRKQYQKIRKKQQQRKKNEIRVR